MQEFPSVSVCPFVPAGSSQEAGKYRDRGMTFREEIR